MKKYMISIAALILLLPTLAMSNALSLRLGYYIPTFKGTANSLWNIEFEQMNLKKANYQNSVLGFAYEQFFSREISFVLSIEGYNRSKTGIYNDYVGYTIDGQDYAFPENLYEGDFNINHAFNVSSTPIQLSVKVMPFGRRGTVVPYIGGGVGLYLWSVKLLGYMVDFQDAWVYTDPDLGDVDIYAVKAVELREENRISFGSHFFGGVMIPVANKLAIEAEVKFNMAWGKFRDAFEGFEKFDLGGYQLALGINYWF